MSTRRRVKVRIKMWMAVSQTGRPMGIAYADRRQADEDATEENAVIGRDKWQVMPVLVTNFLPARRTKE
jgi:hypothetical protein